MLKIAEHEECWWPVTIRQPRDDGSGRSTRFETKWKFRLLTRSEAQKLIPEDESLSDGERVGVILERVADRVIDWEGIDLECTPDNIRLALDKPYISDAVTVALREASSGGGRAKN